MSGIFRFIQSHPDDLDFVSKPFVQPAQARRFEFTDVTKWVAAHRMELAARMAKTRHAAG